MTVKDLQKIPIRHKSKAKHHIHMVSNVYQSTVCLFAFLKVAIISGQAI